MAEHLGRPRDRTANALMSRGPGGARRAGGARATARRRDPRREVAASADGRSATRGSPGRARNDRKLDPRATTRRHLTSRYVLGARARVTCEPHRRDLTPGAPAPPAPSRSSPPLRARAPRVAARRDGGRTARRPAPRPRRRSSSRDGCSALR